MKQIAIALVAAATAAAHDHEFIDLYMTMDGGAFSTVLSTKDWAFAEAEGHTLTIGDNNSLWVRHVEDTTDENMFKPSMLGSSFEFDVNLKRQ